MGRTPGAKSLPKVRVIEIDPNLHPLELEHILQEQANERYILQYSLRHGTKLILYKLSSY